MRRVALETLGCKLNFAETSTLGRQFVDHGFRVVGSGEPCDVYVLNTCSVTERADAECRQLVRRALRHSPDAYVIVVGCYAQLQPQSLASIAGVDLVLGANEKFRILQHAGSFLKNPVPEVFVSCIDEPLEFHDAFSAEVGGRTRAFLKVQDGCDYSCSFCTIPRARGASRSRSKERLLDQCRLLALEGYKEVVLTGVNVGDYGKNSGDSLLSLLKLLEQVNGIERIRVSSIEPNLLSRELIDLMIGSEKVCNHFHIPLQSGSDPVLHRMRRRYRTRDYADLIGYIKECDPGAGIGADVIVGFPGETDTLFEETYRFLADLRVSYLHVFTYSERPDTHALTLDGTVRHATRQKRSEKLRMLSQRKRHAFYNSMIGSVANVLFEGSVRDGVSSGFTENYVRVETSAPGPLSNQVRQILITAQEDEVCRGSFAEESCPMGGIPESNVGCAV